jgi:hypothetical protein
MCYQLVSVTQLTFSSYERILNRIMDDDRPPSARSMAMRILEQMSCSYRPLKKYEILDGISLRPGYTILSKTKIHKDALDLCRPLIEDGPSNTIEFVHFSVKELSTRTRIKFIR